MIKKIIIVFFLLLELNGFSQNSKIYVSAWVNKPSTEELQKPLIFIDFWATWCVPCIHAMPHTELLKDEFGDDVLFVLLSDETSEKVKKFMVKNNKDLYSAIDNTGLTHKNFNIHTIPYSILLNNKGNVIWKGQPLELDRNTLKNIVDQYKNKKGKINRILFVKEYFESDNWRTFDYDSITLKYMEKPSVSENFSIDNNEYYFSGDVKHIVSLIYSEPLNNIVCDPDIKRNFIFKCKTDSLAKFKRVIKNFLEEKYNLVTETEKSEMESFVIKETDNSSFLTANSFDFEKGNGSYLADDMNVTIDNATIGEMANILTDFSEARFVYNGEEKNIYDWKIHYKYIDLTLEQLKDELNFDVVKKKVGVNLLHVRRKK